MSFTIHFAEIQNLFEKIFIIYVLIKSIDIIISNWKLPTSQPTKKKKKKFKKKKFEFKVDFTMHLLFQHEADTPTQRKRLLKTIEKKLNANLNALDVIFGYYFNENFFVPPSTPRSVCAANSTEKSSSADKSIFFKFF